MTSEALFSSVLARSTRQAEGTLLAGVGFVKGPSSFLLHGTGWIKDTLRHHHVVVGQCERQRQEGCGALSCKGSRSRSGYAKVSKRQKFTRRGAFPFPQLP
uniref:Uncharacterized protein n=1 Tax=Leishmania guyanensis TaxID=5670 RepID=A0A1E1IZ04_LEIGU|nr:Hypothetical protein BN36_2640500 [Leishmania guyanensis]CCM16570.1 Hypothetical protein BN36_2640740 [Leishmania guyanensis]